MAAQGPGESFAPPTNLPESIGIGNTAHRL